MRHNSIVPYRLVAIYMIDYMGKGKNGSWPPWAQIPPWVMNKLPPFQSSPLRSCCAQECKICYKPMTTSSPGPNISRASQLLPATHCQIQQASTCKCTQTFKVQKQKRDQAWPALTEPPSRAAENIGLRKPRAVWMGFTGLASAALRTYFGG